MSAWARRRVERGAVVVPREPTHGRDVWSALLRQRPT